MMGETVRYGLEFHPFLKNSKEASIRELHLHSELEHRHGTDPAFRQLLELRTSDHVLSKTFQSRCGKHSMRIVKTE